MSDKKMPEPMDAGAPERPVGEAVPTNQRSCYAVKTLTAEVLDLFPETTHQVSDYNGRSVGLSVCFFDDDPELHELLGLLTDPRISRVRRAGDSETVVEFANHPRTYDLRDSFGLDEAWSVMEENYDNRPDPTSEEFSRVDSGEPDEPFDGADPNYGNDSAPVEGGSARKTSRDKMDGGGA